MKKTKPKKAANLQHHSANYSALQILLHPYQNNLEFMQEFELARKSFKIDLIIKKKDPTLLISRQIGELLKRTISSSTKVRKMS